MRCTWGGSPLVCFCKFVFLLVLRLAFTDSRGRASRGLVRPTLPPRTARGDRMGHPILVSACVVHGVAPPWYVFVNSSFYWCCVWRLLIQGGALRADWL